MAKLRHIALSVPDPWKAAEFYMSAFDMKKVGETDSSLAQGVYLSDGVINMALLKYKDDASAGEDRGKDFIGLHHFGFWVDNVAETRERIEQAGGSYWMGEVAEKGNIFYEVKFHDPLGIVIDLSEHGWGGAVKEVTPLGTGPKLRDENLKVDRKTA